ncbi:unnamed protein product [Phytophthora lilii]|uniref:Unnamed protein product n=1 Tax=Phytophthora lilii TaxID=2077276 RepID=A0A9W6UA51_9STRA|nr:unnamed protein product [Phytophthora lilii]
MSREEYEGMYSTLLYEMTICWDEETNDVVLAKMWLRDASSFSNLDFNRFSCSVFYFAEMVSYVLLHRFFFFNNVLTCLPQWVQEITQDAYDRILNIIRTILSGQEFSPMPPSVDSPDPAFKPTLESFDDAFDRERGMESLNLNIGKSIVFDTKKYFEHFGSPTATIQASNINQFHERSNRTPPRVPFSHRYAKPGKAGCSNPLLLRPTSSRQSRLSVHNSHSGSQDGLPGSPPASTSRTASTFLLAGTIALKHTSTT